MSKQERLVFGSFALLVVIVFIISAIYEKNWLDIIYVILLICSIIKIRKLA